MSKASTKSKTTVAKTASKELSPKETRRARYEAMQKTSNTRREEDDREDFRQYFVKLKRKLSLEADLEGIMWLHFKASGFATKERFDAGVKHFGYEI